MRSPISAMLYVAITVIAAWFFVFSKRHADPPPDFAALELAAADFGDPGSCFSLGEVMIANGISGDADRVWTSRVDGEWMLRMEHGASWRAYFFTRQGDMAIPFQYVTSDDIPEQSTKDAIDALLLAANRKGAAKVPRCANGGGGYKPPGLTTG